MLLLLACAGGVALDSGAACTPDPALHWETFGEPFFLSYCQACHASTTVDRYGAPPTVVFDSFADVLAQRDRILARAASDAPDMPPGGGVPTEQIDALRAWLACPD